MAQMRKTMENGMGTGCHLRTRIEMIVRRGLNNEKSVCEHFFTLIVQ